MIKELVQFTQNLDDSFKLRGIKPKIGLHIKLSLQEENNGFSINRNNVEYEYFHKKSNENEFIEKCKLWQVNAWCIDTNKCFDLPTKAIHSCSPFCVAFKREHIKGGIKYTANEAKGKKQLYERFDNYFEKTNELLSEEQQATADAFAEIFTNITNVSYYDRILAEIVETRSIERNELQEKIDILKAQSIEADKDQKKALAGKIKDLEQKTSDLADLADSDYIIFYLDIPVEGYKTAHQKYLAEKLFNTSEYNTEPDDEGRIFGTNNFMNGYNMNKPFLTHQTAAFDISGRISDKEALSLYELQNMFPLKTLPNPLPIFIHKEELNKAVIAIFKDSEQKFGYREIIEELYKSHSADLDNYYLLNYQNTKDGLVFKDFDFVSKFEYELKSTTTGEEFWEIKGLFTKDTSSQKIENIFDFQNQILPVIFNNALITRLKDGAGIIQKYFSEIKAEYCKSAANHISILKYRQAFYNFIYKSQRKAITPLMFDDMMKISILEDIRLDKVTEKRHSEANNIQRKLNIWFSLKQEFEINKIIKEEETMASKLKSYRQFMQKLANNELSETDAISETEFAFAAGQVISYILDKSKSADGSYKLLEPYLQQVSCEGFKNAIAKDFARYKHENFSRRFENASAIVLTYQTDKNMKKYLPEILAGIFSKNELYSEKKEKTESKETN